MVDLSKFIFNKNILSKIITLSYNQGLRDKLIGIGIQNMRNHSFILLKVKKQTLCISILIHLLILTYRVDWTFKPWELYFMVFYYLELYFMVSHLKSNKNSIKTKLLEIWCIADKLKYL